MNLMNGLSESQLFELTLYLRLLPGLGPARQAFAAVSRNINFGGMQTIATATTRWSASRRESRRERELTQQLISLGAPCGPRAAPRRPARAVLCSTEAVTAEMPERTK